MFSNPTPTSPSIDEGTVVQVDVNRTLCKVKTMNGQVLQAVQWLLPFGGSTRGADRFSPAVGDRVVVNHGLGYPVILGFLPRLQIADGATPMSIDTGQELVDTGNYSPEGTSTWGDQNKPLDMVMGDRLISSQGGAFLGLLRGGAAFLRASKAAEVFLSNFMSLVRVVSRNWEHFTDVSTDVIKNYKGRVYRYIGYAPSFLQAKIEDYKLHFYYGDTPAAEAVKSNYASYSGTPTTNTIVYKEQVTDTPTTTPRELMRRTLDLTGNQEVWIYNGTHFTRVLSSPESLSFSWNDQNTVTIDGTSIHAVHQSGADYVMDANGIRATFNSGTINMSASSVVASFGSTTATLNNSQGTLVNGSGQAIVSSGSTQIKNGSHAVTVTSSGVAIT